MCEIENEVVVSVTPERVVLIRHESNGVKESTA